MAEMTKGTDSMHRGFLRATAVAALSAILISGCSRSETNSGDPYRPEIRAAAQRATSDFEHTVFEDLKITRAEYEEATQRFVQCVKDRGVPISLVTQTGYYIYSVSGPQDGVDAVQDKCHSGTNLLIEPIYVASVMNPRKEDMNSLIAACLVRKGLAPATYDAKKLKADQAKDMTTTPFDSNDPRFGKCLANPSLD